MPKKRKRGEKGYHYFLEEILIIKLAAKVNTFFNSFYSHQFNRLGHITDIAWYR